MRRGLRPTFDPDDLDPEDDPVKPVVPVVAPDPPAAAAPLSSDADPEAELPAGPEQDPGPLGGPEPAPEPPTVDDGPAEASSPARLAELGRTPPAERERRPRDQFPAVGVRPAEQDFGFRPGADAGDVAPVAPPRAADRAVRDIAKPVRGASREARRQATAATAERDVDRLLATLRPGGMIGVMSPKGGAGKSTLALTIADVLARFGQHVAVVDCDPDYGLLAELAPVGSRDPEREGGVVQVLATLEDSDPAAYATTLPSGAHIYAAPRDGEVLAALLEYPSNFEALSEVLGPLYDTVLLDLGAGVLNPIAQTVTGVVDQALMISIPSLITGDRVLAAIDWLQSSRAFLSVAGRPEKTRMAVVVNMLEDRHHDKMDRLSDEFAHIGIRPLFVPRCDELQDTLEYGSYDLAQMPVELRVALKRIAATLCT